MHIHSDLLAVTLVHSAGNAELETLRRNHTVLILKEGWPFMSHQEYYDGTYTYTVRLYKLDGTIELVEEEAEDPVRYNAYKDLVAQLKTTASATVHWDYGKDVDYDTSGESGWTHEPEFWQCSGSAGTTVLHGDNLVVTRHVNGDDIIWNTALMKDLNDRNYVVITRPRPA